MIRPFLEQRTAFGGQYVINYLSTAGGLKGPRRNAKYINAKFMDYPLKKGVYYYDHLCGLSLSGAGAEDRRNQF